MKSYLSYQSTNDRFWNENIPTDWEIKRIGSVFSQRNEKVSDEDYEPLSVTKKGIFPQWENVSKSDSHDNRKLVLKNDFVINSRSDRRGSSGLSNLDGSVSLINTVIIPSSEIKPKYSEYIFKSYEFINEFYKNGRGIVDDLWSTKYSLMKNIYICIPPILEQTQIVSFLDTKTQKIDKLIGKTEQKIKLLKEKRTSLINHCVTKGLNPDVEMKDSGVEWFGEIPCHWKVSKFKYDTLTPVQYGINISSDNYIDEGIRFIRITDINEDGTLNPNNGKYLIDDDVPEEFLLKKFDVLFCRSGHTVGKSYLHNVEGDHTSGGYLVRFNFGNYKTSKFIFYLSKTHFYWDWIKLNTVVSTIENVNGDKYQNFVYPKPPLSERNEIVEYLDEQIQKIDSTIEKETQRIELLKEYRQSLISEVVTGKVDVRDYNG